VTVTGYKVGSTAYATLAEVNAALAATPIAAAGNVTVTVVYTVAPGRGGQTSPVTLTATSRRTPASSDASTTNVIPPVAAGVIVTPDGGTRQRLPSNGTNYTEAFTVQNSGNASDTYTLAAAASPGTAVSIVSVNGSAGSGSSVTVAAGASATVNVVYSVGNVAAGTSDGVSLNAVSSNTASTNDSGSITVQVVRAAIGMTKGAYRDNQTTAITGSDRVLPGEYFQYKIVVTNTGGASAATVHVTDPIPAQLVFDSSSGDAVGWSLSESGGTVTADLSGTLAAGASRYFWIRVRVR
jgi:uncharacterized repeat protein (TIGR01451 family)